MDLDVIMLPSEVPRFMAGYTVKQQYGSNYQLPLKILIGGQLLSGMPQASIPVKLPEMDIRADFQVRCTFEIDY